MSIRSIQTVSDYTFARTYRDLLRASTQCPSSNQPRTWNDIIKRNKDVELADLLDQRMQEYEQYEATQLILNLITC